MAGTEFPMRPATRVHLPLFFLSVFLPLAASADEPRSFLEAIRDGSPLLALRYRYEDVRDDGVGDKHARASTLRTAFGYRSQPWKGLSFLVEGENVSTIGNDLYDNAGVGDSNNGVTDRPVVADPAGTEINQAYARLEIGDTAAQLGRAEIVLGDQRFVGNVGWRQNHQSFDAVTLSNGSLKGVDFFYSFVDNVNRINLGKDEMGSNLANVAIALGGAGKLTLYGYWLDYRKAARAALSTRTLGLEWRGTRSLGRVTEILWEVEYARQADFSDNPNRVDARYSYLLLGVARKPISLQAGYEVLGGEPDRGSFQTPLATLHKWNGWADQFLSTPENGLRDLYLRIDGKAWQLDWTARYHDFRAQTGTARYGDELDFQLLYTAPWQQSFGLKGASYRADTLQENTAKWWIFTAFTI